MCSYFTYIKADEEILTDYFKDCIESSGEDYHVLKKVGSDILNEGVCRDKLFPVDHSMYGKIENLFPGLIDLGIRRRLTKGKNQNETEH